MAASAFTVQSLHPTLTPLPSPCGLCECILSYSERRLHAFNPKLNGSTSQRKLLTGMHKSNECPLLSVTVFAKQQQQQQQREKQQWPPCLACLCECLLPFLFERIRHRVYGRCACSVLSLSLSQSISLCLAVPAIVRGPLFRNWNR